MPPLEFETLWFNAQEDTVFCWGGAVTGWGDTVPELAKLMAPPEDAIWALRIDRKERTGRWSRLNSYPKEIPRRSYASSACDGYACYVVGGFVGNRTSTFTDIEDPPVTMPGLLEFEFKSRSLTNHSVLTSQYWGSTFNLPAHTPADMIFVPNFGRQGIYILVGGQGATSSESGWDAKNAQWHFQNVTVFDPSTKAFYSQPTKGPFPNMNQYLKPRFHCAVGAVDYKQRIFDM